MSAGVPRPHQEVHRHGNVRLAPDRPCKQGGLVETPSEQAEAMKRHRKYQVGLAEQFLASPRKPMPESRRGIGTIAILKAQDQGATDITVAKDRPRTCERRFPTRACTADADWRDFKLKRMSAASAMRRAQEIDLRPAFGAKRTGTVRLDATGQTTRRQYSVKYGPDWRPYPGECSIRWQSAAGSKCHLARSD